MTMPMKKLLLDDEPGLFEHSPQPKLESSAKASILPVAPRSVAVVVPRVKIEKTATAHRTISEVAEELDVPQHVLRFWETKFTQLRPLKRAGGRRYYRTEDVTLIKNIHSLLYAQGYTIKGAQKVLKEKIPQPVNKPVEVIAKPVLKADAHQELREMLAELKALRALV